MRDPWFPMLTMAVVFLAVWLGIIGPIPAGGLGPWLKELQPWQTIIGAMVALIAAYIAFRNRVPIIPSHHRGTV